MKNMFIFMIIFVITMFFATVTPINASAKVCNENVMIMYEQGDISGFKSETIDCTCDQSMSRYETCTKMKTLSFDSNGNALSARVGSQFTLYSNGSRNDSVYKAGLAQLVTIVKAVLNLVIGVTLFLLGGGFLWNMTQMGLHSSNAQKRQEALGRLGEIFGTAIFIGLIPLIVQFIIGIMQGL